MTSNPCEVIPAEKAVAKIGDDGRISSPITTVPGSRSPLRNRASATPVQRRLPLDSGGGVGVAAVGKQYLAKVLPAARHGEVQRRLAALGLGVRVCAVPQQLLTRVRSTLAVLASGT